MTIQDDHTIVSTERADPTGFRQPVTTASTETRRVTTTPSGPELARRVIVLVFGLIQIVIALRIAFLLADARTGNDIVSATLNISQVFVAPFEGILKTDAIHAGGSILDAAAIVALIGWTILEWILRWAIGIFRREPIAA